MYENRCVVIDHKEYDVIVSDQPQVLRQAKESGKAVIGVIGPHRLLGPEVASYAVEAIADLDDHFLELVVCRHYHIPWQIAETDRLLIREFQLDDIQQVPILDSDQQPDRIFQDEKKLKLYIEHQYAMFGFGVWALVEKLTGSLVGKAGFFANQNLTGIEMGYHVFPHYQNQGYAKEACKKLLSYAREELGYQQVYLQIERSNQASRHLAHHLGFQLKDQKYNRSMQYIDQYVWYSR